MRELDELKQEIDRLRLLAQRDPPIVKTGTHNC